MARPRPDEFALPAQSRRHVPLRRTLLLMLAGVLAMPTAAVAQTLEGVTEKREALEAEIADAVELHEDLVARLATAETELSQLESNQDRLQTEMTELNEKLAVRARQAFISRDATNLTLILTSDGPRRAIERAAYLSVLTSREQGQLEGATNVRAQLVQTRTLLEDRSEEYAELEADVSGSLASLNRTLNNTRALESELKTRRERQLYIQRGVQNGTYACPIQSPYHFRDTWGAPRSGGRRHKGTDIFAPMNNQVYAFTSGRLTRLSSSRLGGLGLYQKGDDGNVLYYAHINGMAPGAYVGKYVEAGEWIAYNGDTGNARGGSPHVHFQLHPGGGAPVNPYPWLAPACF